MDSTPYSAALLSRKQDSVDRELTPVVVKGKQYDVVFCGCKYDPDIDETVGPRHVTFIRECDPAGPTYLIPAIYLGEKRAKGPIRLANVNNEFRKLFPTAYKRLHEKIAELKKEGKAITKENVSARACNLKYTLANYSLPGVPEPVFERVMHSKARANSAAPWSQESVGKERDANRASITRMFDDGVVKTRSDGTVECESHISAFDIPDPHQSQLQTVIPERVVMAPTPPMFNKLSKQAQKLANVIGGNVNSDVPGGTPVPLFDFAEVEEENAGEEEGGEEEEEEEEEQEDGEDEEQEEEPSPPPPPVAVVTPVVPAATANGTSRAKTPKKAPTKRKSPSQAATSATPSTPRSRPKKAKTQENNTFDTYCETISAGMQRKQALVDLWCKQERCDDVRAVLMKRFAGKTLPVIEEEHIFVAYLGSDQRLKKNKRKVHDTNSVLTLFIDSDNE
jgi:hypothetical protein